MIGRVCTHGLYPRPLVRMIGDRMRLYLLISARKPLTAAGTEPSRALALPNRSGE